MEWKYSVICYPDAPNHHNPELNYSSVHLSQCTEVHLIQMRGVKAEMQIFLSLESDYLSV